MSTAAVVAAVPLSLIPRQAPAQDVLTKQSMQDMVNTLRDNSFVPVDNYYAVVHPETAKLMTGEIGHYEGIRFIEQPIIPDIQASDISKRRKPGLATTQLNPPRLHRGLSGVRRRAPFYFQGRKT